MMIVSRDELSSIRKMILTYVMVSVLEPEIKLEGTWDVNRDRV